MIGCRLVCHKKNTNTNFIRKGLKIELIKLPNVEGAIVSPNDIIKNS
jgi:hypothetical protein